MSGIMRCLCKCIKSFGAADGTELFFLRRFPVNIHRLSPTSHPHIVRDGDIRRAGTAAARPLCAQ